MIAHHDRIMDMAVVLSLGMTHFEQKRVIRLASWVQEKEGPRVRGGGVTVEVQSKRDRNAVYVPLRERTYLKKPRESRFVLVQANRCSCEPIHMIAHPTGKRTLGPHPPHQPSAGKLTEFTH
jgi:hypothetical protein